MCFMLCCHHLELANPREEIRPGVEKPQPTEPEDLPLHDLQDKNGFYLLKRLLRSNEKSMRQRAPLAHKG